MRQLVINQSITNRESHSLDKYLQELGKLDLVTAEQEVQLAQAIRGGDKEALDRLVKANLRFVVSVAKQYQFYGMPLIDLINEGNLGLIKAASRFDETKGFKFISFAVWWIRQSIIQGLSEKGRMVRLPSNRVSIGNKIQKAISQLEQTHQRAPSLEEISVELNISEQEVTLMGDYNTSYVSLDAPDLATGEESSADKLRDEEGKQTDAKVQYDESLKIQIRRCLKTLGEKERNIVTCFFGIGLPEALSLQEIGLRYGMTSERIRQIKDRAVQHLRGQKKSSTLREYLG